jgi:hypothetical protein
MSSSIVGNWGSRRFAMLAAVVTLLAALIAAPAAFANPTVIGSFPAPGGGADAFDPSTGDLFVLSQTGPTTFAINKYSLPGGGSLGTFGTGNLVNPADLAFSNGRLFVTDTLNTGQGVVEVFNPTTNTFITSHPVTPTTGSHFLTGIFAEPGAGPMYVGDTSAAELLTSTDGGITWTPVASGLSSIDGIVGDGSLLDVARNNTIVQLNPANGFSVVGSPHAIAGTSGNRGLGVIGGGVLVSDFFDAKLNFCTNVFANCAPITTTPTLQFPGFIGTDCHGNAFLPDPGPGKIFIISSNPTFMGGACQPPPVDAQFGKPVAFGGGNGIAVDALGQAYITGSTTIVDPSTAASTKPGTLVFGLPNGAFSFTPFSPALGTCNGFSCPLKGLSPGSSDPLSFSFKDPLKLTPGRLDDINATLTFNGSTEAGTLILRYETIGFETGVSSSPLSPTPPGPSPDLSAFASSKKGGKKFHGFEGKFTTGLPAGKSNRLAPNAVDPNQTVKVDFALVRTKSAAGKASAAAASNCLYYTGGTRFKQAKPVAGKCHAVVWQPAKILPGSDRWYYGYDPGHPLPAGTWTAYVRAITRAGIGSPSIRDQYYNSPYRYVFVCRPNHC